MSAVFDDILFALHHGEKSNFDILQAKIYRAIVSQMLAK